MLGNIAHISSGHLFRSKPDYVESGGYPVIQMKDISPGEPIDWGKLVRARVADVKRGSLVRKGDVLLKSKGASHLATTADDPLEDTVVSSQIIIIRVSDENVLPEYVGWYLNQEPAQRFMGTHSVGTNIRHLNMKHLRKLPIMVPEMRIQQLIANVRQLRCREKDIVERIQNLRSKLINATMLKKIGC